MKNLVRLLTKKKLKLSVAESCTGGMLASSITSISGASKIFNLGLVTYSNQAKIRILRVNKNIIKKYGAVSHQCCLAMVNNLSKISKANINVSITGIAGPKGGTKQKPVGLEGPLNHLTNNWTFSDKNNGITEVTFDIDFEIKNKFLNSLMVVSFQFGLEKIADAFQKRAEDLFSNAKD